MPYEVMLKQAHDIVDEIPREKIQYVVQFLQGARGLCSDADAKADARAKSKAAFEWLQKNRRPNSGIDYEKELQRSREERFL